MNKRDMLEKLLILWESGDCHHLRLGQLLVNSSQANRLFYLPDEQLVEELKRYVENNETNA